MTQKLELRKSTLPDGSVVFWIYLGPRILECFFNEIKAEKYFNDFKLVKEEEAVLKTREISNGQQTHFSEEELMSL